MIFRLMTDDEIDYWYDNELAEAFTDNEMKPLSDIHLLISQDKYELWGLFEEAKMTGYAAIWKDSGIPLVLLDYLGVTSSMRNSGLGAKILDLLKDQNRPIVAESELPIPGSDEEENAIRVRRINFYNRNGFQPVYEMATCGFRWQAFLYNPTNLLLQNIMTWHKALYGPNRDDVQVPIGPDEIPKMPYWM